VSALTRGQSEADSGLAGRGRGPGARELGPAARAVPRADRRARGAPRGLGRQALCRRGPDSGRGGGEMSVGTSSV
jgi:hypothetical protein